MLAAPQTVWLDDDTFGRELRAYVTEVAAALGVGPESTMVDATTPASAYLALDGSTPAFPDRDLALLWDERVGWSAVVETRSGDDLVLGRPDPVHGVRPAPEVLVRFVRAVRAGDIGIAQSLTG
ncbi:DUF6292 family protein [Kutzneria kofuensis]|uniref:DUF6292 domain-containing protein n=1 Tax=Kutzneria kofuensis TaxID=103725 RepID=A0A7W9KR43_9PSEU|nr:DUF6292 family protein [Kutzneria kofuensis]MBB5897087.1 hypothetical protein [Kutzneria kofuensis]